MKKFLSLFTAIIMIFTITACSKNTSVLQDTPENALMSYLEAVKASDAENIVKTTQEEYKQNDIDNMNMLLNDKAFGKKLQKECKNNLKYEIKKSEIQDDMAYVSVDFTYTDMSEAFRQALPLYMSYFISNLPASDEAIDEKSSSAKEAESIYIKSFEEAYEKNPPKKSSGSTIVTLKITDGKWYVAVSTHLSSIVTCGIMGVINNAN